MIAIRNENQILASGNEAYKIYEKTHRMYPLLSLWHLEKLQISTVQKLYCSPCLKEQVLSDFLGIRYILQFRQICLRLKKGLIIQSEIPREK